MSRSMLYYHHKQPDKDWWLKQQIELVLRDKKSYGYRRIADHLGINRKRALRVMKLFGIKPYRRRGRKYKKPSKDYSKEYPNLLLTESPLYPNHIWASDFTYIPYKKKTLYLATIIDLFTREIVGFSVMLCHSNSLVINALLSAVSNHPVPAILHSDQGSEYKSKDYIALETNLGITPSMSHKGCPWENGYQEAFYSQFKVDLGDPNRFNHLGELVWEIYKTIYEYNNNRIHSSIKMPPAIYAKRHYERSEMLV
jgi:putative transposase